MDIDVFKFDMTELKSQKSSAESGGTEIVNEKIKNAEQRSPVRGGSEMEYIWKIKGSEIKGSSLNGTSLRS